MFEGILLPVCTPFKGPEQSVDIDLFCSHLDWIADSKVHIIGVNCGTSEFAYLSKEEKLQLAEVAGKRIDGKAKLLIHTTAVRTEDAVEFAKHAEGVGADMLMVAPPYLDMPGEAGVMYHYEKVAKAVNIPIMAYNHPYNYKFDITPDVFKNLTQIPNIEYMKDSTSDMQRLEELVAQGSKIFLGWDSLAPYGLLAGAVGIFSGGANIVPHQTLEFYNLYREGKYVEMMQAWEKLKPLYVALISSPNFNSAVKSCMRIIGHDLGICRLPTQGTSPEEYKKFEEIIAKMNA